MESAVTAGNRPTASFTNSTISSGRIFGSISIRRAESQARAQCSSISGITPSKARAPSKINEPSHVDRSEEHTSELQSLMRISYAVFCLKNKTTIMSTYTYTAYITDEQRQYK